MEFYFVTALGNWKGKSLGRAEKNEMNLNSVSGCPSTEIIPWFLHMAVWVAHGVYCALLNSYPCQQTVAL